MALIDEAKTILRVMTEDEAITSEIQSYIDSSILDLTKTADIKDFGSEPDALVKTAIFTYVKAMWTRDTNEADRLMRVYETQKKTLLMSSAYGTYDGGVENGWNESC